MVANIFQEYADNAEKRSRSWCSKRLLDLIGSNVPAEVGDQAAELIQKRRLLDFSVIPGRVTAKVQDELGKAHRVEILFQQFSDKEWEIIFARLTEQSYYLAQMLSSQIPQELENIFSENELELFPKNFDQLIIAHDTNIVNAISPSIAAVLQRLCEKLDNDPFSLFILKGRGRDETIAEIRKRRSFVMQQQNVRNEVNYLDHDNETAPPLGSMIENFWSSGSGLAELSYSIRADELPASILKWLDPPPLGGLEHEVDYLLEEAYERVARLAQAFGLRL